jgi:phosphoinositide-3-kinase, regulatory subunit 4
VCYVAPERFLASGETKEGEVTDAMDVFSLGCVIAELFLEGTPVFSLSQMLKFRKGQYDPMRYYVEKIEDVEIRSLVSHMTALDPAKRYSAEKYLQEWQVVI